MSQEAANETKAEVVQRELGRRLWQQLATQDWVSVPFSETYCKSLFFLEHRSVAFAKILNRRQSTALLYQGTSPV
jgi:hypothetical protein